MAGLTKRRGKGLENFQGGGGGGGSWMYEVGETEGNPNAKGLELIINSNFTMQNNLRSKKTELLHVKLNYRGKHH